MDIEGGRFGPVQGGHAENVADERAPHEELVLSVVSWNVGGDYDYDLVCNRKGRQDLHVKPVDEFKRHRDTVAVQAFQKIFRSADPDVISLQEVGDNLERVIRLAWRGI